VLIRRVRADEGTVANVLAMMARSVVSASASASSSSPSANASYHCRLKHPRLPVAFALAAPASAAAAAAATAEAVAAADASQGLENGGPTPEGWDVRVFVAAVKVLSLLALLVQKYGY
jgi:hypothetical protein